MTDRETGMSVPEGDAHAADLPVADASDVGVPGVAGPSADASGPDGTGVAGPSPGTSVRWRGALALLVVLLLAEVLVVVTHGTTFRSQAPFGLTMLAIQLSGVAASIRAATRPWLRPSVRRLWWGMVAVFASSLSSGAASAVFEGLGIEAPLMSAASVALHAVMYPVLIGVLLSLPARPLSGYRLRVFWYDVVTVAGCGVIVIWYLLLGRVLVADGIQGGVLFYPLGDILLLFTVSAVLMRGVRPEVRLSAAFLVAGSVAHLLIDVWLCYQVFFFGYHFGDRDSLMFRVGVVLSVYLMFSAAVMQSWPPAPPLPEDVDSTGVTATGRARAAARRRHRPVALLPYVALLLGYLTLTLAADRDPYPWAGLVAGAAVMTVGVVARQIAGIREMNWLATTDSLTQLPCRRSLGHRLDVALSRAADEGTSVALLILDLDGFKQINDQFGHAAGDDLLVRFATGLRSQLGRGEVAARLGGDEFAILLPRVRGSRRAVEVASAVLEALAEPVLVAGRGVRIRCSIGLAVSGRGGCTAEEMQRRADSAMFVAKRAGGNRWEEYVLVLDGGAPAAVALERDLRTALGSDQLFLEYQPIIALETGEVAGAEALLRWRHPEYGLIPPADFVPVAEATGLIHDLGTWVLRQAIFTARSWQRMLPPGRQLYLSVNLSPVQLSREWLVTEVAEVLHAASMDPASLVLEVTESSLVRNEVAISHLRSLRGLGPRIALDDFGTGYSSLQYLTRLPVDILKVDRCFVTDLANGPRGYAVAETVIRLARVLQLDTIAEGIETPDQAEELTRMGCRAGQGYHFSRPLPADRFEELVRDIGRTPRKEVLRSIGTPV